jgi:hypothetical protein
VVVKVVNLKWVKVIKIKRGGKKVVKLNEIVRRRLKLSEIIKIEIG